MIRDIIIVIELFLIFFFVGCENDIEKNEDQYIYPLAIGNRWEYRRDYTTYFCSDSIQSDTYVDTISGIDSCSIIVLQNTILLDSIETVQLLEQFWDDSSIYVGLYFYQERDTGLFQTAYQNPNLPALPKYSNSFYFYGELLIPDYMKRFFFKDISQIEKTSENGTIHFEDPPVLVLKYPLEIGNYWTYRLENQPFRIDKEVIQDTLITVPAGTFNCYQIHWIYDYSETFRDLIIHFNDFIADEGLILRKIYIEGISYIDSEFRYSIFNDEYKLMDFKLR